MKNLTASLYSLFIFSLVSIALVGTAHAESCRFKKPDATTWVMLNPMNKNGKAGMHVTWTQYGANKVDILIDDGTGKYPWKISNTSNDGHEFLANVQKWQKVKIKPENNCRDGVWTPAVSYNSHPRGWYNVK